MRRLFVSVLLGLVLALSPVAYADVIKTKDGKKLEGKITEQTKEFVRLRTGYGDLTIPRAEIDSITISFSTIHFKDGRRMDGIITEETTKEVVLRTKYGELKIPHSDIEKIERPKEYIPVSRKEPPRPARKQDLSNEQRARLHQKGIELLRTKKFDEAIAAYKKIVADGPGSYYATSLYNLACAYSLKGEKGAALDYLEKSAQAGYLNFRHMNRDPDLDNIRNEPRYKALMARKEELMENWAESRADSLKREYGQDYIVEVDHERKIVYATNQSRTVLDELKKALNNYADAQWRTFFENKPNYYLTIICPNREDFRKRIKSRNVGGVYSHGSRTLICGNIGSTLIHEFTHALHFGDQDARGQGHPIWILEGLATCFETSTLIDGKPTPMPNYRLNRVRLALATGRYYPWNEFMRIPRSRFMSNTGISYPEARYIMYYFWQLGKLKEWYDTYCANYRKDRTGILATEITFGKSVAQVEEDFRKWIAEAPEGAGAVPKGAAFFGVSTSPSAAGMHVRQVVPGSVAEKAGVKPGDIIIEFAGKKYTNRDAFAEAIRAQEIGVSIKVTVLRGEREIELEVELQPKE